MAGRNRWVRLVGVPVAAVSLVGLAACGTGTTASGSTGSGASGNADMDALRTCLEQNGVTLPAGGPDGGQDGSTPPSGAPPAGSTPPSGTPQAGGTGQAGGAAQAPPGVDAATWAKAQQACAQYAPAAPGGAAPAA